MLIVNCRFLTQNLTGVQRYGYELFKQISQSNKAATYVMPTQDVNENYKFENTINLINTGKQKGHLWEQLDLPAYLKNNDNPLLLNLCNTAPVFYKNKIVTIHDLAFMRGNWHSRGFKAFYKTVIPLILKNARKVLTVSEFSKKEIVDIYKIPANKIAVVYNAPFSVANINGDLESSLKENQYILSVGSMDSRKNLKRLIYAFLSLKYNDIKLKLIGRFNSNFKHDPELVNLIETNKHNIDFLGYVTDAELISIYKNALCFVYPSLYEGFGLPPIEAMAHGCPVIVSDVSSLPEVCGDGALYCDPLNVNDIAEKMKAMVENAKLRESYIFAGQVNAGKYSWEKSGQALLKELEGL